MIEIPVSPGELLDKISILEIKARRIKESSQRSYVDRELALLRERWQRSGLNQGLDGLFNELRQVNEQLWEIEDAIRQSEKAQCFDERFIDLARSVYLTNDRRAALKRLINDRVASPLREVKSYVGG